MLEYTPQDVDVVVSDGNAPWDTRKCTGWFPPPPDPRDRHERHESFRPLLERLGTVGFIGKPDEPGFMEPRVFVQEELPKVFSLRDRCPPVRNQSFGNCTAYAQVGIAETMTYIAHGKRVRFSERFNYKVSRWLAHLSGDSGSYNRAAMRAGLQYGFCPHEYFKNVNDWEKYDKTPNALVHGVADEFKIDGYLRHDHKDMPLECVENSIKKYLLANVPSVTGYFATPSWNQSDLGEGYIAPPDYSGDLVYGHAVGIIGWDDNLKIKNLVTGEVAKGAFECRNSWGSYGDDGYIWLPYQYMRTHYAQDIWSMLSLTWFDTEQFGY